MKSKLQYIHVLTQLPIQNLQEIFEDELWDEQIRQDFLAGKFDRFIDCMENQQEMPYEFAEILTEHFWELVGD